MKRKHIQQDADETLNKPLKHNNSDRMDECPHPEVGLCETNTAPSLENRASEDDELGEDMTSDDQVVDYIEENQLEKTDQDYRDADNQAGEDQDDEDDLRNGK